MQPLLLLHGAIGASVQLKKLAEALADSYEVYTMDFTGHGGQPIPEEHLSIELFANDVLRFMVEHNIGKTSIFGYSMGGYVGMYLARHQPDKVEKLVTLATKYHWNEEIAGKEIQMLNADKIVQKLPAFAESLRKMHEPADWKQLLAKTAQMMVDMGADNPLTLDDYPLVTVPTMVLLGDRDKMVSLDETLAVYKSLPGAQMGMLPNTSHPIDQVDAGILSFMIRNFLK